MFGVGVMAPRKLHQYGDLNILTEHEIAVNTSFTEILKYITAKEITLMVCLCFFFFHWALCGREECGRKNAGVRARD